jgi:BirA family biotin operon repressor/biotin-[acetyl-CoA-carboxylase] ligase
MSINLFDSNSLQEALKLLSDGQFHSGEELGALLGVSRAAVWKALKKLELLGIDVISIKGKGYCINGGLDLLDASKILVKNHNAWDVKVFAQVDSTNSYLLRQKQPERQACLAENQTAGRGRRGRTWVSPFAQNLYLSIGWGFDGGVAALEGLSLAIGLGVVRSLRQHGVGGLSLKWPNDILYDNKKLGGILIEMSGDPAGYCLAVVGIGLNVSMSGSGSASIEQPWINLADILAEQSLPVISRNQLASSLLDELGSILSDYHRLGFTAYRDEWVSVAAYVNQAVSIHAGNVVQSGVLRGVDRTGALQLDIDGKEHTFHGGEVSLRSRYVS